MAPMMSIGGIIMAIRQVVGLSWILAISIPVVLVVAGIVIACISPTQGNPRVPQTIGGERK
nr:hypothetical protein [Nesterenkonia ebinurensis]